MFGEKMRFMKVSLRVVCIFILLMLPSISIAQTVPGKNLNIHATGITGVRGVSHDSDGNAYTMGRDSGTVSKITPTGVRSVVKELGAGFYVGPFFDQATGDIYISNCTGAILRLNPLTGVVNTLATVGATCAGGFTSDAAGNIYVSDFVSSVVKITPSGNVSTYATGLISPDGIDFGPDGELYIGNRGTNQVMVVAPGGGAASVFASGFNLPLDVLADDSGNVFAANYGNGTISEVTPGGTVSTIGTGFVNPLGLAFDITGNLIIADFGGTGTIYSAGPLVLFSDTFDNDSIVSGTISLSKWTVTSGNVDVIGPGFADLYTENGTYLDMDGAISNATIETPPLALSPGTYELSFELGNNSNLGSFDNGVLVSLGTVFSQTFLAPAHANFSGEQLVKTTIRFVIENSTLASLIFQETGTASSGGAVIDDVLLVKTDVIEPRPANTEVVFSGAFDDETSSSLSNDWFITAGNVDLILDDLAGTYPGNGKFVDMDGTGDNANATIVSNQLLSLTPGTYHLTFGLGDNKKINDSELNINLGPVFHQSLKAPIGRPALEFYHFEFTVIAGTTGTLSFQEIGIPDWHGTLLDDVLLYRIAPLNQTPTADAGNNQVVEQQGPAGSSVMLDGSGSSDPDGDTLTYSWSGVFGNASGELPTVMIPATGSPHTVTLVVNDGTADSESDTVQITVQDTIAPAITVSNVGPIEATGPETPADIAASANAADLVGVDSFSASNNGPFTVGTTAVIWTAMDAAGNTSSATQNVTIDDTTAPAITVSNVGPIEATGPNTTVDIAASASATDLVGVDSFSASNNGPFAVGTTAVIWTAMDAAGNTSTATQNVTIVDTTAPVVTATDRTVEATGPSTPVDVSGDASATDAVGVTSLTNDSPGSFPANATTQVNWTASDAAGNTSDAVQNITIQDTIAPVLTAPADVTVDATGTLTPVDLGTPTATDAVGVVTLTNDAPAAGFPVDSTTTVTWTAKDAAGNTTIDTQIVTIRPFVLGVTTGKTKLKIHRGDGDKDKDKDNDQGAKDWLQIAGTLTEFSNGDGLNFLTDPVTIVLNGFTWNLPPGSFVLDKGDYKYKGGRTGLTEVKVKSNGKFKLKAKRMDLSGLPFATPIPFSVTIGNDFGETDVTFNTRRGKDNDKGKDKDKDDDKKKKGKKKGK
jgi:hypothetical protein